MISALRRRICETTRAAQGRSCDARTSQSARQRREGSPNLRRAASMDKSYGSSGAYTLLDDQDALTQQQKPQTVWQSSALSSSRAAINTSIGCCVGATGPVSMHRLRLLLWARDDALDRAGNELHVRHLRDYCWVPGYLPKAIWTTSIRYKNGRLLVIRFAMVILAGCILAAIVAAVHEAAENEFDSHPHEEDNHRAGRSRAVEAGST